MRKLLLAAAATAAIATPAFARDGSPYVGIEGGAMIVQDMDFDLDVDGTVDGATDVDDFFSIDHKVGYDVDLIAGYDFGRFRAEAELGYKRASHDEYRLTTGLINTDNTFDGDGHTSVLSLMGNLLLDFGDDDGFNGYAGVGAGIARTKISFDLGTDNDSDADTNFAWQAIAGVRAPISDNIDLGLKYRYFRTKYETSFAGDSDLGFFSGDIDSKFRSHSLLASLIFNFGAPPAPPPPPPPAPEPAPPPPATQTCPDGSVILATDSCPVPPPPPPPPPPAPERG